MKKTSFVFVTMLTVLLSGLLMACSLKKPEVSFTESEIVVSVDGTIDLNEYLETKEVSKNEITYNFSNASMFEVDGGKIKAVSSGRSFVYATYQNNNFDSMQIVVKKQFPVPTNFNISDGVLQSNDGILTWGVVSDYFETGSSLTTSSGYTVAGSYITSDGKVHQITPTQSSNSFDLPAEAEYSLKITANAKGYFDASVVEINFSYGLISAPASVSYNSGIISWQPVNGAKYKVKLDDAVLGDYQEQTTKDISQYLKNAEAGVHNVSVVAYDATGSKLPNASQALQIEKLAAPEIEYDFSEGGKIKISAVSNAEKYVFVLKNLVSGSETQISLNSNGSDLLTSFEALDSGAYSLTVVAKGSNENTYQSNECSTIDGAAAQVYKLPRLSSFEGLGGNDVNGETFKAEVAGGASLFDTKVLISGVEDGVKDGLLEGQNQKELEINLSEAGTYVLGARLMPKTSENEYKGSSIFVLNGDESEKINVNKLAFVGEVENIVEHKYVGEKSVFVFDEVASASTYEIKNDETVVQLSQDAIKKVENKIEITLDGKIDDLFDSYEFEIVAKGEDDKLSINASTTKSIEVLQAPTVSERLDNANKTYSWNASANAVGYRLEVYYTLDKTEYEALIAGITTEVSTQTYEVSAAEYTFEDEGYYYVKLYALTGDENEYLDSKQGLTDNFYITEKLILGQVNLGYDASIIEKNPTSDASGYFVRVADSENVAKFKFDIGGIQTEANASTGDEGYTDYNLTNASLEDDLIISIVALGADQTIYLASDAKTLSIKNLEGISYDSFSNGTAYVDETTQNVIVKAVEGAREIYIRKDENNKAQGDSQNDAILPIGAQDTNFELEFEILGSQINANNLYEAETIYLDAKSSKLQFVRYETPTNLEYKNGKLNFVDLTADPDNVYVLNIKGKQAGGDDFVIKVEFDNMYATAIYLEEEFSLSYASLYRSIVGQNVSINIETIIDFVNMDDTLSAVYANAAEIEFEVFVYKNAFNETKNYYEISSLNATLKSDSSKDSLTIEKMSSAALDFDRETDTTYILKWNAVSADNTEVNNETVYQIYSTENKEPIEGVLLAEASGVLSFEFSKTGYAVGQYHNFYIVATNPYYLESNKSNLVRIFKLNILENVKVKNNGTLELMISSTQKDFISKAVVNDSDVVEYSSIAVPTEDTLTVKLIGKSEVSGTTKTYYVDSDVSTWSIAQLSTLAPSDTTLSYNENGNLTWDAFGASAGLGSLKYRVYFKDKDATVVYHDTIENKVNVLSGEVYNKIAAGLTAGSISVQVVAYLNTYWAANSATNPTIYISDAQTTFGEEIYNAYVYGTKSITKLSTPAVSEVEFESIDFGIYPTFEEETFSFDAQNPATTIHFTGNYGDSVTVLVFVNENETPVYEGTIAKSDESSYSFGLDSSYYEFDDDGVMTITIKATVAGAIPSSLGSVQIARAADLTSIEFVKIGENYSTELKCVLTETDSAAGGVVVKLEYADSEGNWKTLYTLSNVTGASELNLDLQDFVADYLAEGGKIKASTYLNSSADDANKEYYLPSKIAAQTSGEIEVLKAVEESEIVRQAGGFKINSANGDNCIYVVEYGGESFEITSEKDFYFEFPNDWSNGTYNLVIYAKEDAKMSSIETNHSFTLTRLSAVDKASIAMTRSLSDMSQITLSWSAVENATSYLFRVYDKEDETLIYETNLTSVSNKIVDIFGINFANILSYGVVDNAVDYFKADKELRFEIVASGDVTTYNSSKIASVDVLLKGNSLLGVTDTANILTVDEIGRLHFAGTEGEEYLYKYFADGVAQQNWNEIIAVEDTILDSKEFSKLVTNPYFNMLIANKGEEGAFELDSYVWTTQETAISLKFNSPIVSMGYNENLVSGIALEILNGGFEKIYAGLSDTSLYEGNVAALTFVETELSPSNNINKVYACALADLIDAFAESGISLPVSDDDLKIFVWAYSPDEVASMPHEFSFVINEESTFEEIKKTGETFDVESGEILSHDYANVYAVFVNNDTEDILETLGIYVKIEREEFEKPIVKFLSNSQIVTDDFEGKYIVNITNIFEESDLIDLVGDFKVSFSRLQVQNGSKLVLSDWIENDGVDDFVFTRLSPASAVSLVEGNVSWTGYDGGKYYVYFAQDLNLETMQLGQNYSVEHTSHNNLDASNFVGLGVGYYIGVQVYLGDSEDENKFVLPSKKIFVSELKNETIQPVKIYKNEVNSPIVLKDGQISIEWPANSEILRVLTQLNSNTGDLIKDEPFKNPFTFTIADLVNDKLIFRLRFTAVGDTVGVEKTFDVNAKDLMADLFAENDVLRTVLEGIHGSEQSDLTAKSQLKAFLDYCDNSSHGVGNARKLFDEVFESLQAGSYSMKYCLLGSSKTLTSVWYDFKNENGENIFYVNPQPTTYIKKETTPNDATKNVYKLIIKQSSITTFDNASNEYVETLAESYVVRLVSGSSRYVLKINRGNSNYVLTLQDSEIEANVSVYVTDESGNVNSSGQYLMFYINHNEGNSLLGVYGEEIVKNSYEMQIFAVGNDYSMSSKSKYHSLTFLSFGTGISIVDGEFLWVPHLNKTTTVVYKKLHNAPNEAEVGISSDLYYSRFSLNSGEGFYEYIKFVVVGETKTNSTFIDSEVYMFNNVYKLGAPTTDTTQTEKTVLSNKLGFLSIDLGNANKARLDDSYSETNIYNYRIYNNVSNYNLNRASTYISISDDRSEGAGEKTLYYQPGTTGLDASNGNFAYKSTEKQATQFSLALMGSTITNISYQIEQETDNSDEYNANYHLRTFKRVNEDGSTLLNFNIALRSNFASINAEMMQDMGELTIDNSLLSWDEVELSAVNENHSVETAIYKVAVTLYENTSTGSADSQQSQTSISKELIYYTAQTSFDFAKIEADLIENTTASTLIKVTVQAMALNLSETRQEGSVGLVEGGFAYGTAYYLDESLAETEVCVLMSNGAYIDGITRYSSVENLSVEYGKLVWTFEAEKNLSQTAFREKYDFEVVQNVGEQAKIVSGNYTISEYNGIYKIVFMENEGEMLDGICSFSVYAKQGTAARENSVKSFATTIDAVTKLAAISVSDYEILSDVEYEVLDFSSYFAVEGNENNVVILKSYVDNQEKADIEFTKTHSKLYIFREIPQSTIEYEEGFIHAYLTISNNSVAKLRFAVSNDASKTIFSDQSEEFVLQRSAWGEEAEIVWDETVQEFSWSYDYNTFASDEQLQAVTQVYLTNKTTNLFADEQLSVAAELSLASGEFVDVQGILTSAAQIRYAENVYYVAIEDLQATYKSLAKTLNETAVYSDEALSNIAKYEGEQNIVLEEDTEVVVLDVLATATKVAYQSQTYYVDSAALETTIQDFSAGELFKVVEESQEVLIIEDETRTLLQARVQDVEINRPEYTIEATYGTGFDSVTRIYTTSQNSFKPTIIGDVSISITIKLGTTNVESQKLLYDTNKDGTADFVRFDLFASGAGTSATPYQITNAQEFKNIQYRMTKEYYLQNYHQEGVESLSGDGTQYYFELSNDISLLSEDAFNGVLFSGAFSGVLNGNNNTIEYLSNNAQILSNSITISEGNVLGATANDTSTTFNCGAALFEETSAESRIESLNIKAHFGSGATPVTNHALIAALAIKNQGVVSDVNLVGYDSNLYGAGAPRKVMAYGGIVGINYGSVAQIANCETLTNIQINDLGQNQLIFVGGIAYANLFGGLIEECVAGSEAENYQISVVCQAVNDIIQIAGVVVTNSATSKLNNDTNHLTLSVTSQTSGTITSAYLGGIACYGKGTTTGNTSTATIENGKISTFNISSPIAGNVFAVS